ncbi:hypothetical protein CSC43_7150 [Pseudomonas aeruginosa]|nr:hypothetical protein CSC26_7011 [Pseudomonas aeruginosa]RCH25468.1 hypothetical protein CSC43_7150 [Pseudomonas aeruginosa]
MDGLAQALCGTEQWKKTKAADKARHLADVLVPPLAINQRGPQNHPLDTSALSPRLHSRLRINQLCRDGVLCRIARADFRETAGGRQRHHPPRATRLDERKIIRQHPDGGNANPVTDGARNVGAYGARRS